MARGRVGEVYQTAFYGLAGASAAYPPPALHPLDSSRRAALGLLHGKRRCGRGVPDGILRAGERCGGGRRVAGVERGRSPAAGGVCGANAYPSQRFR
ncbi:hypothetical protein FBQ95_17720 [Chloroflexi bacterium CFX3]|nr:hypothetical protein [Chloroflexi bacterium CFX3]